MNFPTHQAVAVGDDGKYENPSPDDGPLLAGIRKYFDGLHDRYQASLDEFRLKGRQQAQAAQAAYAPQFATGTIPSSGNLILDFGGPQQGRRWVVRMVTYSDAGSFWNSTSGAKFTVCTGLSMGTGIVAPQMVRWASAAGPNCTSFSADQMWIIPNDHVLLSVTGGTSGQNISATLWIQDFDVLASWPQQEV